MLSSLALACSLAFLGTSTPSRKEGLSSLAARRMESMRACSAAVCR